MRLALALMLLGTACDGDLPAPPEPVDLALCVDERYLIDRVLEPSCGAGACHDANDPKGEMDLVTPGLAARLGGHVSIHVACRDRSIVVPGVPQASFIMDKILGTHGPCGDPMPALELDERRCLVNWIASLPQG